MTSYQWLVDNGLPAGPFDLPLQLVGRFRARRLHLDDRCARNQVMSPDRKAFAVHVLPSDLRPLEHLCQSCAKRADMTVLSAQFPGGPDRKDYTDAARSLLAVRTKLTALRDSVTAAPGPVPPATFTQLVTLRGELQALTVTASGRPSWHELLLELAASGTDVELALDAVRRSWNTPQARAALVRGYAAAKRRERLAPTRGHNDPVPSVAAHNPLLARPFWMARAVGKAYPAWVGALVNGADDDTALMTACATAVTWSKTTSSACELAGIPLHVLPTVGEDLTEVLRAAVSEHTARVTTTLAAHWSAELDDLVGPDDGSTVLALVKKARPNSDPSLHLGMLRGSHEDLELLEVPAALARLQKLPATTVLTDPAALTLTEAVLSTTIALHRSGLDLAAAALAAQAVLLPAA